MQTYNSYAFLYDILYIYTSATVPRVFFLSPVFYSGKLLRKIPSRKISGTPSENLTEGTSERGTLPEVISLAAAPESRNLENS